MSPALDPVTLALVQNRLDHISHQMGWVMTRTARSPIFSQSHDFSCFLADARGTLISQADGIPIHTGGGGFAVGEVGRRGARQHGHELGHRVGMLLVGDLRRQRRRIAEHVVFQIDRQVDEAAWHGDGSASRAGRRR